jgi:hypothetical protein
VPARAKKTWHLAVCETVSREGITKLAKAWRSGKTNLEQILVADWFLGLTLATDF